MFDKNGAVKIAGVTEIALRANKFALTDAQLLTALPG